MNFINHIQNRYTTKKYDNSKKIESRKIEELQEILRLCPSSINSQPWEFVFIGDQEMKDKLAVFSKHNTAKVQDCDTLVVFRTVNNLAVFYKELKSRLPEYAMEFYKEYADTHSEKEVKIWMEKQVYIALGMLLSACASMQIDATPMEGIEPDPYDKILGNKNYTTVLAVAIGVRDTEDFNQLEKKPKSRKSLQEVVRVF
ncbi:nitroreductase family protein [Wenyingzhuangia sp. 2_MG-2023]|uniref:nitroreductase family protein n=1 Tax=Wenyingzhuangia sp. 2_MG-2023 TaxID=3062639 RepID=UPI0026E14E77|nr:nitroreductase family protein [Wenyingzhuangia sp. 2_MG-2023]MDO6739127.1 nitroreductase family protein [Wenyingzhuangia sp. 2_MG-2023]